MLAKWYERVIISIIIIIIARRLGLHYNHSVHLLPVSENVHNSWTAVYFLIKFCILIHFNIIETHRDTGMQNGDKALPSKYFVRKPSSTC